MVQLERGRGNICNLRRAATIRLSASLIRPSFDKPNIGDRSELTASLNELATGAGLLKQKRWSVTLPEVTNRTLILTLETQPGSNSELEEVLTWKMERGFGVALAELSISKERLPPDSQGRDRYMVVAARTAVLDEYESVLNSLGWRAGLILPRHMGEAQWLTLNGFNGDALLLSSSDEGFTAVVFRGKEPLLFYRDRRSDVEQASQLLTRLLVIGDGFTKDRARGIVNQTLGTDLRVLDAEDLGLQLPTRDLSFDAIAAPAGLAKLSWQ